MATPDYQVGAHFKALNESVRVAALKLTGYFFYAFQVSLPDRVLYMLKETAGLEQRKVLVMTQ